MAALPKAPFTVGFAAETDNLHAHAQHKLAQKKLNMIAANRVGDGLGFEREENALEIFWPGGSESLATAPKETLARQLLDIVAIRYRAHVAQVGENAAAQTAPD